MKKKIIIGGIIGVLIIGAIGYSIIKSNKEKEVANTKIEQQQKEKEVSKNDFSNEINGLSDQELIKKYLLLENSKIPVKDRAEASEVARKFAKAITEYNSNNPTEGEKEALSCVSDDIYKDVQGMFITKGKDKESDIKEKKITRVKSEEKPNSDDNDYIYIDTTVVYEKVDKHNQKKEDVEGYVIQLLKINGEYKVTSFRVI